MGVQQKCLQNPLKGFWIAKRPLLTSASIGVRARIEESEVIAQTARNVASAAPEQNDLIAQTAQNRASAAPEQNGLIAQTEDHAKTEDHVKNVGIVQIAEIAPNAQIVQIAQIVRNVKTAVTMNSKALSRRKVSSK